jgi:hypothetical protein
MKKILNMKICTQGCNTYSGSKRGVQILCAGILYLAFIIRNLFSKYFVLTLKSILLL